MNKFTPDFYFIITKSMKGLARYIVNFVINLIGSSPNLKLYFS